MANDDSTIHQKFLIVIFCHKFKKYRTRHLLVQSFKQPKQLEVNIYFGWCYFFHIFIFWVNIFQFCSLMHSWEILWKLKQTNPFHLARYARLKHMLDILFSFRTYTAHASFFGAIWVLICFSSPKDFMLFVTKRFDVNLF